jgi:3-oxoacyl-[acyl-carrier protein] reductase
MGVIKMNLKDQIAIVTGASRGIGFGIADALSSQGVHVVVVATQQAKCDEVALEFSKKYGTQSIGVACDVASMDSVQSMVKSVVERFGRVDILVNNAGITRDNLLLRMSEEEWSSVISVNLNSVFFCTKAVLRPMLKQKSGRIINISSVVGVMGNAGQANYAASKAGIIGFTKSIAREIGAKGITCNAVAPGFIDTDMISSLPQEYLDNIMAQIPQKRLGVVNDVSGVVLFLSSEMSAYVTGQVIHVDGGMQM